MSRGAWGHDDGGPDGTGTKLEARFCLCLRDLRKTIEPTVTQFPLLYDKSDNSTLAHTAVERINITSLCLWVDSQNSSMSGAQCRA